jgi:hypothetical protein
MVPASFLLLLASLSGMEPAPDSAPAAPFLPADKVADAALAGMRGGLRLPDGLDVQIGIDIETRLNGALILHTIYSSDGPNAGIKVYTGGTSTPARTAGAIKVSGSATSNAPVIVVDRTATGTIVSARPQPVPVNAALVQGSPADWPDVSGQNAVAVTANGPAVSSGGNGIQLTSDRQGAVVTLDAPGLEVRHLVGRATGVVIANTGNDRVIDTASAVNVTLQGLSPVLMSSFLTINRIAASAAQARGL